MKQGEPGMTAGALRTAASSDSVGALQLQRVGVCSGLRFYR
jgi:hypothetical protein